MESWSDSAQIVEDCSLAFISDVIKDGADAVFC